ncbi:MAG TPA: SusD/RagB family nutrient-binding outer membrane lipoprotein [Chitinophagaceae bacterium]|jgi:hypothetical protein|nr:SusD/RagB family nutrient-binding outer membrane lipoprotein [Chitinophagaceae bacterium]
MKLKKLIYSIPLAVILIAAGTGCRKSQFNINQNPNDPTDSTITYDVILPAALHATGANVMGNGQTGYWSTIQNWMGFWSRSGSYAPNVIEETYQITTSFGNQIWNACYDNSYDYNVVQRKAAVAGATFYEGIARIMKAHCYQVLVDVYGNVPFTEALKGNLNPTPAYDKGLEIYKSLLREIDAGITLIKNAVVEEDNPNKDINTNDIMFGEEQYSQGTMSLEDYAEEQKVRWIRFANTLKLRLLIHAYAVPAIDKAAEIAIINAEGSGYLDEDAMVQPGYAADKPMPFFSAYKTTSTGTTATANVYYVANKWGVDYYKGDGDPRQTRFYEAGSGGLIGVPYGTPPVAAYARAVVAGVGPGLYKTATAPQMLFSLAEAYFLRAEARERGFITTGPSAQALMESGILASFTYLATANPAADLTNYLAFNAGFPDVDYTAPPVAPGYPAGGLTTILSQKWFALNGINPLEVWTDYRRVPFSSVSTLPGASTTHFTYGTAGGFTAGPTISVSPQLPPGTTIPVRYLYPQAEYNYNSANVSGEGTINQFTSRIFWDIN